ncbi:MAG: putative thioesterase [Frankiales bacterium]|nr:putative thioesterase [Frankiales bacterium]
MDNEVSRVYCPRMDSWGEPRSKTVTWYDPMATAAAGAELSGLDYLTAMVEGRLPRAPISGLLSFGISRVSKGEVTFTCEPDESAYNPIGVVHGGLVCTLLDSVTACAVHSTLDAGIGYTSLDISVSYLRPVTKDSGLLVARGWVTRAGRRAAFSQGEVTTPDGKVVATATSTCLVFPR